VRILLEDDRHFLERAVFGEVEVAQAHRVREFSVCQLLGIAGVPYVRLSRHLVHLTALLIPSSPAYN
jgi:hypothetical protein